MREAGHGAVMEWFLPDTRNGGIATLEKQSLSELPGSIPEPGLSLHDIVLSGLRVKILEDNNQGQARIVARKKAVHSMLM